MPANDKLVNPLNPWELRFLGVFFCLNVPSTQSQGYSIMTIRTKDEHKKKFHFFYRQMLVLVPVLVFRGSAGGSGSGINHVKYLT